MGVFNSIELPNKNLMGSALNRIKDPSIGMQDLYANICDRLAGQQKYASEIVLAILRVIEASTDSKEVRAQLYQQGHRLLEAVIPLPLTENEGVYITAKEVWDTWVENEVDLETCS